VKLKSKRGFRIKNIKRGAYISVKPGEIFELDELTEEKDQILQLLSSNRAFIVDESFLPKKGVYMIKRSFAKREEDGSLLILTQGRTTELDQETATALLMDATIVRESERDWNPRQLISGTPKAEAAPRKMYDEEPQQRESFVNRFKKER
jgi:hypothetical protein